MRQQAYIDEENDDSIDCDKSCYRIDFPAEVGELKDSVVERENTSFDEEQR